jgi:hypothetical protein
MAIEAPASKYKLKTLIIYIVALVAIAGWCVYDGYFNEKWIEDHKDADGNPETYLVFNRKAPPYLGAAAVLIGIYRSVVKNKKILADENGIILGKQTVSYDSIEKIDKTQFEPKGYFIITYKNERSGETDLKISDRNYDNLQELLDHLVAKIS